MTWLYTPPWNTRVIVAVAVVLLALALMRWWRERRGGALVTLRVLLVGALLWVALNPQALLQRERTGKPKLAILIDTSAYLCARAGGGPAD